MKTMTCKQLGGACDEKFTGKTFDEIAQQSKKHGLEMMQAGDKPHLRAIQDMRRMMSSPDAMKKWMDAKRKEFETTPENN